MINFESNNRWATKLAEQARILGEARMLRDEEPVTTEARAAIVQGFRDLLERIGKPQSWAARSMGVSETVISEVIAGTYKGDDEKQIRKMDKWIEQQVQRESAPKPAGYVKTRVAEMIKGTVRWVLQGNMMGCIHGPAGIGKSICLRAIAAETTGSIMTTIVTAGTSKMAVLNSIACHPALRLGGVKITSYNLFDTVVKALAESNRLIIVDEIHKLEGRSKDAGLHVLRDLHDATGCPMIWAGMSNIAKYILQGKSVFEPLDQISSRIKFWLDLTNIAAQTDGGPGLYTVDDVRRWLKAQEVRVSDDGVRYLHQIANTIGMGGLRTCDGMVRVARVVAGDRVINAEMLRQILVEQRSLQYVEAFERQAEIRDQRATG